MYTINPGIGYLRGHCCTWRQWSGGIEVQCGDSHTVMTDALGNEAFGLV
jgi:homoaconitase/3-isopropylmalate dehydratase large subunit